MDDSYIIFQHKQVESPKVALFVYIGIKYCLVLV